MRKRIQTTIDENMEKRIIECSQKLRMEKNDFIRFVLNSFLVDMETNKKEENLCT